MKTLDDCTPAEWRAANLAAVTVDNVQKVDVDALNAALDMPFGECGLFTKAFVFLLHQTGKVAIWRRGGSCPLPLPTWHKAGRYQVVLIEKPETKPSIDWSVLKPEYKWLARDVDGLAYTYSRHPTRLSDCWANDGYCRVDSLASYVPGDCDWKDSLVERPV